MPFQGYTIPAPNGGYNGIDAIDAVPETDALELINLYPKGSTVALRGGVESFCDTTEATPIRSLYTLPLADGTSKTLAAVNNKLIEVSTGSPVDDTGSTTPSNEDWNGAVYGHKLYLANGSQTAQVWDGSTTADVGFSGVTLADLINVSIYKERIYWVEKNSGSVWYPSSAKATSGALTEFDLSYYFTRGGKLLFAGSYTDRQGDTSSDLWMACTSEGELFFYSGSYPGDSAWVQVARYPIGKPLGSRAFVRVDNDVWIITEQGIVPVSMLFQGGGSIALNSVARKVNPIIQAYAKTIGFSHLWHGLHWTQGKRVFITVPTAGNDSILLVCNTETGAWTKYVYQMAGTALALALYEGQPYFGAASGKVYKAENNQNDAGEAITFDMRLPWNFFGTRGNLKKFADLRPIVRTQRGTRFTAYIDTDFKTTVKTDTIIAGASTSATSTPWGSSWGSPWSTGTEVLFDRYAIKGQGHCGAIRVTGAIKDSPLEFNAFEVRFEIGSQI